MSTLPLRVALVGSPNCGKTALFNQLTGARQKVANYAGVTVERKAGQFLTRSGRTIHLLDLPGAYSLESASLDERVTRDLLLGRQAGEAVPDLIVCVIDATNLRLHLRFLLEIRRLGPPVLVALNMMDEAARRGIAIDVAMLERELGLPIVETVAIKRRGADALVAAIDAHETRDGARAGAPAAIAAAAGEPPADIHAQVRALLAAAVTMPRATDERDDRLDRWTLHPVLGLLILAIVMFITFQAVYSIGKPLTDAIGDGFGWLGTIVGAWLPDGPLRSLLTDGILTGLGTVLGFLPEILVLFLFILVLEESGYLPRAAFLLDRMMLSVGLTGRSFIPLLSSFACAIPGILGTRSITDPRDRLATILVAPLMTCSARLPVYALLIGAFIPAHRVAYLFNLQGLVLFLLYAGGIGGAMLVGFIMKKIRGDREEHALLMELPSYRVPRARDIGIGLWERGSIFLKRLTGVILALTVLMWFISTFPSPPDGATGPAIDYTFAGYIGRSLETLFAPLGFNWQISLSLIPAFAARETAVAALATVYAVSGGEGDIAGLGHALTANFSLASALSLLVWFAFAPQCMSTLAVIRRETRSWKNVAISFCYMFAMAYAASLVTYQIARAFL
ncbi:ferrous iron transporter B [Burkholderia plantarii]|uniref:Fe(2+) transporter FeoB n=1 Tax=Burkholderia plantarii TaxID=41899 RepID=A0A0B6RJY0_BURPL|nr:ferrous iron transporter B [Burkholderia plantarii]AJK45632.1 ferrous iron transport protein FeoB [Burkholderia plantarii]ALK29884.1 ferrous iron transport protein B [Burkholderia plantarii]WLE58632.1 ferrous iron transporter B [Burkholderia plantarii]GLZ20803.1 ferrous iron transporter B [Burkholderia plantarii]